MAIKIKKSHHDDDCKEVSKMNDPHGETPVNSGSDVNKDQFEVGKPHDSTGVSLQESKGSSWMKKLLGEVLKDSMREGFKECFKEALLCLGSKISELWHTIPWEEIFSEIQNWLF